MALPALAASNRTATIEAPDKLFVARAAELEKAGKDFDTIFAQLCQLALDHLAQDSTRRPDDQARALFGGLWLWARAGGKPALQGQLDKALHFIGGGAFQGYWDAGRSAAVIKEEADRRDPGNAFDLDDMAATMIGARWMDLATGDDQQKNRAWLERWATGKLTLSRSLPKLDFGRFHKGAQPPPELVKSVQETIHAALKAED